MGHFQEKEGDKTVTYYLQTSVEMENIPKFPSSHVRGTIYVTGFIFRSVEGVNKVDVTYIVTISFAMLHVMSMLTGSSVQANFDPAGYIPSSLIALVSTEMPLCIARIRGYLTERGFPPHIPHHTSTFPGTLQGETYDHAPNTLEVQWKPDGAGSFSIIYDKSRWTSFPSIVPGENTSETDFKVVEGEGQVTIVFEAGVKDKNLHIVVKKD